MYIQNVSGNNSELSPLEIAEIAVDREAFRVLLGLLPPRLSTKEIRVRK